MKNVLIALSFLVALSVTSSAFAQQRPICGSFDQMSEVLSKNHKEVPVARGLQSNGQLVIIFANENGSFTVLTVNTNGRTCMVSSGEAWETLSDEEIAKERLLLEKGT